MSQIKFDDLYLPDGQLLSYREQFELVGNRSFSISLELSLYISQETAERKIFELTFGQIIRATKSHHFKNHEFHIGAGNVSHGLMTSKNAYLIYLCYGLIDIEANQLTIKKK